MWARATWTLLVALAVGGAACNYPGADGFMKDGAATDLPADSSMASDMCPAMDSGVDAASEDGGDAPAGRQCGGSGTATVTSTHGSFELHSVFVMAYACSGTGFNVQFADDSTPRRTVEFYLPLSPHDPAALLGTRAIGGLVGFGDSNVSGVGTVEITSATDPYVARVAFPAGHIEGRFSFHADGCTTASGTFSTPYCAETCLQI